MCGAFYRMTNIYGTQFTNGSSGAEDDDDEPTLQLSCCPTPEKVRFASVHAAAPLRYVTCARATGRNHCSIGTFAAISTAGILYTWGENHHGMLGRGPIHEADWNRPISVLPQPIDRARFSGLSVATVASARSQMMAVTSDGNLWAWGLCTNYLQSFIRTARMRQSNHLK